MEDIRRGRYWLLAAQFAAILPQWDRLPLWLFLLLITACLWRLPGVEIRVKPPSTWLRVLILTAGAIGLWRFYNTLIGPEAGTAFLILCVALKILETRDRRDCYVVIILGFFVVSTNFLFVQSLATALYTGVVLVLIVAALLAMHQPAGVGSRQTLRQAVVMVGQTLPLVLILFLFFPRLPPLWTLRLSQAGAHTGMTDSMSPGDIAHLSQSEDLAFRVEFHGPAPGKSQLYWRGLVLSQFDGTTWRPDPKVTAARVVAWAQRGDYPQWVNNIRADKAHSVSYRVIIEPSDQPWLFGLIVPASQTAGVGLTQEFSLINDGPLFERKSYDVTSFSPTELDPDLTDAEREAYVALPSTGNPQARAMAASWHAAASSDMDYIQRVLKWYRTESFVYTLDPPALSGDRIDQFLFTTRQGFCEHYASSFVFLMRAAGIPARVVIGYQGGELSPYGDYWQVRQMDAHAWAEVWLPGRGWTQFDPTAAVSPDRIRQGMSALAEERDVWGKSGSGGLRYGNYKLLNGLREWADYVNYRWYKDILGYDTETQDGLMQRLLGDTGYLTRALVMAGLFAAVLGVIVLAWYLRQPRRHEPPEDRYYRRYCARLAKSGLARESGEGAQDFAARVARVRPRLADSVGEVTRLYVQLRYKPPVAGTRPLIRRLRYLARMAPVKP